MKNKHLLSLIVIILISWLGYEFKPLIFEEGKSNENIYYSKISSADLEIYTDKMIVRVADSYSEVKNCKTKSFANCIIYDSTIIAVPNNNVLKEGFAEENMFTGKDKNIEFSIKKELLDFRGKEIEGFRVKIHGTGEEFMRSEGDIFYTYEKGVVSFTDFDKQLKDELPKGARLVWLLSGDKGAFSLTTKKK